MLLTTRRVLKKRLALVPAAALLVPGIIAPTGTQAAVAPDAELVSVNSAGEQGDGGSWLPSASGDGSRVAFLSTATNLVPDDTNGVVDAFVRDVDAGWTKRVNLRSNGEQSNSLVQDVTISGNGRWVAFTSADPEIVEEDDDVHMDMFLHDLRDGSTKRVSRQPRRSHWQRGVRWISLSYNGRFATYFTLGRHLRRDRNIDHDAYLWDRYTGSLEVASVTDYGTPANGFNSDGYLSADGGCFAFYSDATNLDPSHHDQGPDVFLRDFRHNGTRHIRVSPAIEGPAYHLSARLSATGKFMTYEDDTAGYPGDDGNRPDAYVANIETGWKEALGVAGNGNPTSSGPASISGDGTKFAFRLIEEYEEEEYRYRFLAKDIQTDRTVRMDLGYSGQPANRSIEKGAITLDGTRVAFSTDATNLVPGDTNETHDVFIRETGFETDWTPPTKPHGCGGGFEGRTPPLCMGRVATVVGTWRSDSLRGSQYSDVIHGRARSDGIRVGGKKDYICGGAGDDRIVAYGGDGHLSGGPGDDHLQGGKGFDVCIGGPGDDTSLECEVNRSM